MGGRGTRIEGRAVRVRGISEKLKHSWLEAGPEAREKDDENMVNQDVWGMITEGRDIFQDAHGQSTYYRALPPWHICSNNRVQAKRFMFEHVGFREDARGGGMVP